MRAIDLNRRSNRCVHVLILIFFNLGMDLSQQPAIDPELYRLKSITRAMEYVSQRGFLGPWNTLKYDASHLSVRFGPKI